MARPVCKEVLSRSAADQSASTYPASKVLPPGQDGDTRVPVLIKVSASSAVFEPGFRSAVRLSGHLVVTLSQTPLVARLGCERLNATPPSSCPLGQTYGPPRLQGGFVEIGG